MDKDEFEKIKKDLEKELAKEESSQAKAKEEIPQVEPLMRAEVAEEPEVWSSEPVPSAPPQAQEEVQLQVPPQYFDAKPPKRERRKFRGWGYIATAVVSVVLSVALTWALVPSIQRGKLPFTPTTGASVFEQYTSSGENQLSVADIAKKDGPCIVGVNVTAQSQGFFGQVVQTQGSGSGIIMSSDGYIVTNDHVVDGATSVNVILYNGDSYTAKVIGVDTTTDLAVIKIEPKDTLQYAEFGTSSELQVGDLAVAIGNPLGQDFAGTVTVGFISALNRTVQVDGRTYNLIQTDAAINEGNSGGALINQQGQVIGINSVKISSAEGMGFAIPIDIRNQYLTT